MTAPEPRQHAGDRVGLSPRKKLFYSLAAFLGFFAVLEGGLRLAGLGKPATIGMMQFGYEEGIPVRDQDGIEYEGRCYPYPLFQADAKLFWKPISHTPFTGIDGLRIPVPSHKSKPAGTYRVAVIGDSCSFLGRTLYAERFARLAARRLNRPADVVNASCPGYSSFQGLRRLDDVWAWRPDLLVVFFGWNDHWKSLNGCTDRELADRQKLGAAQEWLGYSRIYWTAYSALARPRRRDDRGAPVRVPLDDYQNNLTEILRQARRRQCQVLMITAPTALVEGQLPAWVYPFFGRWYNMSLEEILAIPKTHAQYNEVVRRVAAEHRDAALLDLAASWPQVDTSARFRNDSIHLTEAGHEAVAAAMFELWSQSHIP